MRIGLSTLLLFFSLFGLADSQPLEKAVIAHNSIQQVKKEAGVKKQIALTDIVDYRILKEVAKEIETNG